MKISEKYRHIGYSYPGVPNGWKPIVEKAIIEIEKVMWPRWIPLFLKRKIHYWATDNTVVKIKNRFWYYVRCKLTKNQIITDIKDKYATLRIYGFYEEKIESIIRKTDKICSETCESCGGKEEVRLSDYGWVHNYCIDCRKKKGPERDRKKKPVKKKPANKSNGKKKEDTDIR